MNKTTKIYLLLALGVVVIITLFKSVTKDPLSITLWLGYFVFLTLLFIPFGSVYRMLYRAAFITFAFMSFVNEAIIKNEGSHNMRQVFVEMLILGAIWFLIETYEP